MNQYKLGAVVKFRLNNRISEGIIIQRPISKDDYYIMVTKKGNRRAVKEDGLIEVIDNFAVNIPEYKSIKRFTNTRTYEIFINEDEKLRITAIGYDDLVKKWRIFCYQNNIRDIEGMTMKHIKPVCKTQFENKNIIEIILIAKKKLIKYNLIMEAEELVHRLIVNAEAASYSDVIRIVKEYLDLEDKKNG